MRDLTTSIVRSGFWCVIFCGISGWGMAPRRKPELKMFQSNNSPLENDEFRFAAVPSGSTARTRTFLLKNIGVVGATNITLSNLPAPFSATSTCASLKPNSSEQCNVVITLSTSRVGFFRTTLDISYKNSEAPAVTAQTFTVTLIATVEDPPPLVSQLSPAIAASGQRVFLQGQNLARISRVQVGGVSAVLTVSGQQVSLTVPNGLNRGEHAIAVNNVVQTPKLKVEPFCNPQSFVSDQNSDKNLAINHQAVVTHTNSTFKPNDLANSTWSFGFLMGRIAGFELNDPQFEAKTAQFIEKWARSFQEVGTINGHNFGGRNFFAGVNWPRKSPSGILDLQQSPMRLIAILYRPDLANTNQAGEGRFIYEVGGSSFTVILEFGLPINAANSREVWAKRWAELSPLTLGTAAYINALKSVTTTFADQRFAGRPNGSAINQVRSNEIALNFPWQLREWTLRSNNGAMVNVQLLPDTVKQTPKPNLSPLDKGRLNDWWENVSCSGTEGNNPDCNDVMPQEFLAGAANTDGTSFGIGADPAKFDMITCNGCHGKQITGPLAFVHAARGNFSQFLIQDLNQRRAAFREALLGFCQ